MSGSQTELNLVVCFALLCFLLTSTLLKPLHDLWQRREEYWFANRHPSVTWIIIANILVYVAITQPLKVYHEYLLLDNDTEGAAFIVGFVSESFFVVNLYGLSIVVCIRYWLLYFDVQIAVQCKDNQWKELLLADTSNGSFPDTQSFGWFAARKPTLGSWNFLKRIAAALCLILSFVFLVIYWFSSEVATVVNIMVLLSTMVFLTIVSMKMPRYSDNLKAHDEYVLYIKVGLPFIVAYIGFVVAEFFKRCFITEVIQQANSALCGYCILCVMLVWVPHQFEHSRVRCVVRSPKSPAASQSRDSVLLPHVISQTNGFRAFMGHLFTEFSYDNLLCCVELLQFRQLRRAAIRKEDADNELQQVDGFQRPRMWSSEGRVGRFQLPEEIMALSPTIATNESVTFEQRFLQLFDKYISVSAAMPVNLSFRTKRPLVKLAEGFRRGGKSTVGYRMFDDVIVDLSHVMEDSYSRFELTEGFRELLEHISV